MSKQAITQFIQALQQKEYDKASKALKLAIESKLSNRVRRVVRAGK